MFTFGPNDVINDLCESISNRQADLSGIPIFVEGLDRILQLATEMVQFSGQTESILSEIIAECKKYMASHSPNTVLYDSWVPLECSDLEFILSEIPTLIRELKQEESKLAKIFYNLQTTSLGELQKYSTLNEKEWERSLKNYFAMADAIIVNATHCINRPHDEDVFPDLVLLELNVIEYHGKLAIGIYEPCVRMKSILSGGSFPSNIIAYTMRIIANAQLLDSD